MRLSMQQTGIVEAKGKISNMQRKAQNLRPALKVGASDIAALMLDCFTKQEDPSGVPWEPLAPSTLESRARRGDAAKKRNKKGQLTKGALKKREQRKAPGGSKILIVTGRLKNSMFARALERAIEFGSNVKYLAPHQTGGEDLSRRMIAPVEKRGGKWVLIRRGPARQVFDSIEQKIRSHVTI